MSLNKAMLIGRLGDDPKMADLRNGTAVCNMSIATSRRYNDKQTGEVIEETEWHRVTAFGKTADNCGRWLAKGRQVYVEGRLRTRKWEKDGITRYSTEVIADTVQFLGSKGGGAPRGRSEYDDSPAGDSNFSSRAPDAPGDDDIPF